MAAEDARESAPGQEKLAELAETLEEHRGLLLRLDAAREQHEATMHAQSKWIVRQVAVLLRDCALRGGGEAAAGQQQDAAPEVPGLRERRGNLVYPLTVAIPEMSFEEQESAESAESSLRAASPSRPRRAGAGGGAAVALRDADGVGGGAPMRPRLSSRVSFDVSCAESSDAESGSPNRLGPR
ncbi:unnamed protein product [Prorocentrum cordatum]|uniref:Uncharacterized protein n=1 Tax=Prorocentrum cordatum TaxID=2364126 RepID=A0ABN9WKS5_9DINO|nr:unnamed protein product [Polarella glacialis]